MQTAGGIQIPPGETVVHKVRVFDDAVLEEFAFATSDARVEEDAGGEPVEGGGQSG